MCPCHAACIEWWVLLYILWVPCCFLVICALIFKLPPYSFFSFYFSALLLLPLFWRLLRLFYGDFCFRLVLCFSEVCLLFPLLFLFAIRYVFLISPFFLSFFFCNCCPLFFFLVCYRFLSVYFATYCVFSGCSWWVVLKLG